MGEIAAHLSDLVLATSIHQKQVIPKRKSWFP
jgi:hypothetical protein